MLLLIAIAFLLKRHGTHAVPLPAPAPTSSSFDVPVFARDVPPDGCHTRTVLDILWSCLATTFACTWVSVHPNVPFKGEGKWTLLRRRIFLMFFSILAPEFMSMWAFKQWRGAVMIREAVNKALKVTSPDTPQWTTTHGHFLQMGGFHICTTQRENLSYRKDQHQVLRSKDVGRKYFSNDQDELKIEWQHSADLISKLFHNRHETLGKRWTTEYAPCTELTDDVWEGVLTFDALKKLLAENLINLPTITEDEINDRSKGDALSKGIALLQLTWFIAQISTRAVQGLAITELELTTAALAGLNSIMFIFWWSKPRDVRFPVVIRSKGVEKLPAERTEDTTWDFAGPKFEFHKHLWTSMITPIEQILSALTKSLVSTPAAIKGVLSNLASKNRALSRHLHIFLSEIYPYLVRVFAYLKGGKGEESTGGEGTVIVNPETPRANKFYMHMLGKALKITLIAIAYCIGYLWSAPAYIINCGLIVPIERIIDNSPEGFSSIPTIFDIDRRVLSMMFYGEKAGVVPLFSTATIAGALFGAVHCLAWHFNYSSHAEQTMWRIASLGVVGTCVFSFVCACTWEYDEKSYFLIILLTIPRLILGLPTVIVYPVCRLMLLVLAITSLRSLPPSAFDTIQWIEFVPHI